MPQTRRTLPRTLGQLALALLNATLLLALALVIAGIVLIGRVQGFAADTAQVAAAALTPGLRARIDAGFDGVTQAMARLDAMEARLATATAAGAAAPQLQALRAELATLTGQVALLNANLTELRATAGGGLRDALRAALTEAAHALDTPATP